MRRAPQAGQRVWVRHPIPLHYSSPSSWCDAGSPIMNIFPLLLTPIIALCRLLKAQTTELPSGYY